MRWWGSGAQVKVYKRLTAKQALEHRWITNFEEVVEDVPKAGAPSIDVAL